MQVSELIINVKTQGDTGWEGEARRLAAHLRAAPTEEIASGQRAPLAMTVGSVARRLAAKEPHPWEKTLRLRLRVTLIF